MRVLIDTCVILDCLQSREPFFDSALNIFIGAARNEFEAYVSANTMTDLYYIIHRHTHSAVESKKILSRLTQLFFVLDVCAEDCLRALHGSSADYEDAVMIECARRTRMDHIVTRNVRDYAGSPVPVLTPDQFLMQLSSTV